MQLTKRNAGFSAIQMSTILSFQLSKYYYHLKLKICEENFGGYENLVGVF